ncbi:tRNA (adenosine(37)-N6)-dimethylallyltransferase MiaA [Spiroplasma taiwanense]|uniref:tRNA dimethylallyltransferase n=1 Tax=Spiroplasma taiwanense CT-1 TaxID=1276220 RepID=S5LTK3_9MOLU|nr:tRNA (adenosine(37)-N6)-dimethylallyltransferase MiaA [Spiroplasma taiwanense]AGR41039.1 tRNA delta(2)-isopentenylpyrophosphate transferase [Spiroplasma taiwanense CT-1]
MQKIILIVGPTASGKTDLSIKIAKEFNGECINSDSTQIYKGTDIATNKINSDEMQGIKHHLLSIREVNETYSVADFQKEARGKIRDIISRNKNPIIVGGTGLYVNALIMDYNFTSKDHISNFNNKFLHLSNQELWDLLDKIDNLEAKKIHPNNRNRIIRALEINKLNDNIKSNIIKNNKNYIYDNLLIIGLIPNRSDLYNKINNRVLQLTDRGLFDEIRSAYIKNNFNKSAQALKCIGGPEIIKFIEKEIDYEQCIELMQKNNRHYARRQITWFKNQLKGVNWFEHDYSNFDDVCNEIIIFIKQKYNNY